MQVIHAGIIPRGKWDALLLIYSTRFSLDVSMETFQSLFDKHGTPPPEICLDWAWQLKHLTDGAYLSVDSTTNVATNLAWSEIGVDETGQLVLLVTDTRRQSDELVSQLVAWSTGLTTSTAGSGSESLQKLPQQFSDDDLQLAALRLIDAANLSQLLAKQPSSENLSSTSLDRAATGKQITKPTSVGAVNFSLQRTRPKTQPHTLSRILSARKLLIGSIATLVVLVIVWLANPISHFVASPEMTAKTANPTSAEMPPTRAVDLEGTASTVAADFETGQLEISLSTTDELARLASIPATQLAQPLEALNAVGFGESIPSRTGILEESAKVSSSTIAVADPEMASNVDKLTKEKSVIEEIQTVTRKAEAELHEISVATSDSGDSQDPNSAKLDSTALIEPLVIDCESVRQVFKLKEEVALKPKEPVWQMRLDASEGFIVEPPGAQQLAARGSVFWAVYDAEATAPRTRIIVQAQQASGRKGDVLWHLTGSAEDLPMLSLPLARQWLDPLRIRLKQFEQLIRLTLDQLQQQSKQPGLPSQARSLISAKRQWAEQQRRMLERALTVIAETDRLVGLVDGRFEIHGQLQDGIEEQAPVLLKFGSIEVPAAETEPLVEN